MSTLDDALARLEQALDLAGRADQCSVRARISRAFAAAYGRNACREEQALALDMAKEDALMVAGSLAVLPLLLDIAEAAMAWDVAATTAPAKYVATRAAYERLRAALAKVQP